MKKNKIIYKASFLILYSALLSSVLIKNDCKKNTETVIEITDDLRDDLYNRRIFNMDKYESNYGKIINGINILNNTNHEDRFITEESLDKVYYLNISMDKNNDLNILNKCKNLRVIYITNAEYLNDDDIKNINNSSVNLVMLNFNISNILNVKPKKFDLSKINKELKITGINYFYSEYLKLLLMNYFIDYNKDDFYIDIGEYIDIDNKLDKIIDELDLENLTYSTRILKIINYVINQIEYDERVKEDAELLEYYNFNELEPVIDRKNSKGVCVNYAALFDIICYKCDIPTKKVNGDSDIDHAWNIVYLDNQLYYLDLTKKDVEYPNDFLNDCIELNDEMVSKRILREFYLENIFELNKKYQIDTNIYKNSLDEKNVILYNENIKNTSVINNEINYKKDILLSLLSGIGLIGIYDIKNKSKKLIKNKNN